MESSSLDVQLNLNSRLNCKSSTRWCSLNKKRQEQPKPCFNLENLKFKHYGIFSQGCEKGKQITHCLMALKFIASSNKIMRNNWNHVTWSGPVLSSCWLVLRFLKEGSKKIRCTKNVSQHHSFLYSFTSHVSPLEGHKMNDIDDFRYVMV
jgi:hypothetical protein